MDDSEGNGGISWFNVKSLVLPRFNAAAALQQACRVIEVSEERIRSLPRGKCGRAGQLEEQAIDGKD